MCIVGAYLAEFLEYLWLILWCDPDAGVTDRDFHRTISLLGFNSDPSSLRCELHGIGKQVEKNLFDLPLVTYELPKALVDRDIESDAVLRGPFPHKGACVIYCQGKVELSQFKLHTASLNLRK